MEKANEFIAGDWPIASATELADHEKLEASYSPEQLNQPVFALIRARKALNDAIIAVSNASRKCSEKHNVRDRLVSIGSELKQQHARFPLTIVQNGGGHPRPSIGQ